MVVAQKLPGCASLHPGCVDCIHCSSAGQSVTMLPATDPPASVHSSEAFMSRYKLAGLAFVFLWFFAGGIGHFLATGFFLSIVPPYVPWPVAAVYVSGVFELLGAFGLIPRAT